MSTTIAAAWLSGDILLVSVAAASGETVRPCVADDAGGSIEAQRVDFPGTALVLVRTGQPTAGELSALSIRIGEVEAILDFCQPLPGLRAFCREHLAAADASTRGRLLAELTALLHEERPHDDRLALSRNLRRVRDALRERLPHVQALGDGAARLAVDSIIAVDDRRFVVTGAMSDQGSVATSLTLVSPEGLRADLTHLCRHAHHQRSGPAGFTGACAFDAPSVLDDGWRLELRTASGNDLEVHVPRVVRDLPGARRILLALLSEEGEAGEALLREHVFPALDSLQTRLRGAAVARVTQFGVPPAAPVVSVVVPLAARADLLEHQLAQFARHADMGIADLVYVDDCSAPRGRVEEQAAHLHALYRVPFRLVTLAPYAGFAAAMDAGIRHAVSPLIAMLAPEAMPTGPGWLQALIDCHQHLSPAGAARPVWVSVDGAPRDPAPAPQAAGLVIESALLSDVGGLCGRYVDGESEAADIVLRLSGRGIPVATCPDARLYLLRGEPRFGSQRHVEARYERWVRTVIRA